MYLPTFWKLTQEFRGKVIRRGLPWLLPVSFACKYKIYNKN